MSPSPCFLAVILLSTFPLLSSAGPPADNTALEHWLTWRDEQIDFLLQPFDYEGHTCIEILGVADRALVIRNHLDQADPPPNIAAHLQRLHRFTTAMSWQVMDGHEMGFPIPDQEYLDQVRDQITFPPLLRSQEFLDALHHPSGYADAKRMLDGQEGWVSLFYQSRFIETPDRSTHGRLLIWIPGNPEQWIQFGIITPEMDQDTVTHGASIVSLLKRDNGATRTAIVDYWCEKKEDRIELQTKVEAKEGGANCYNCHKSGVIPIRPHRTYILNEAGSLIPETGDRSRAALEKLNDRIKTYGTPDFGFGFDTEAYGPSVGPPDRERSLGDIARLIHPQELPPESLSKVRKAMRCASCHNPSNLGRLNYPSALVSDHDFIDLLHPDSQNATPILHEFITQGWMPPHQELSSNEREALYQALMKEYYNPAAQTGILVEWLKQPVLDPPIGLKIKTSKH